MSEFKIEKGVKMPAPVRKRNKYPWADMKVGDSFFVELEKGKEVMRLQATVCWAANQRALRYGGKYSTRQVDGGVRCWRIE